MIGTRTGLFAGDDRPITIPISRGPAYSDPHLAAGLTMFMACGVAAFFFRGRHLHLMTHAFFQRPCFWLRVR